MLNICSSIETFKHPNAQMLKHSIKWCDTNTILKKKEKKFGVKIHFCKTSMQHKKEGSKGQGMRKFENPKP